jgi:hypothetical protein
VVLVFVQPNVAPAGVLAKVDAGMVAVLQTVTAGIGFTTTPGFTVIVNVCAVPVHPFNVGVAVKFPVIADVVALLTVNELISPVPLATVPIAVLSLVQLTVLAAGTGLKVMVVVESPAQTVWLLTGGMDGIGFMVMLNVCAVPVQPSMVGVAVKLPVRGTVPAFTPVKAAMLPVPVEPTPIVLSLLVQLMVAAAGLTL